MILVVPAPGLEFAVEEFFELFKTPWTYWKSAETSFGPNDVVLTNGFLPGNDVPNRLIFMSSKASQLDQKLAGRGELLEGTRTVLSGEWEFPVYQGLLRFPRACDPLVWDKETGDPVAYSLQIGDRRVVRLGYDLFREVFHLLVEGQRSFFSKIPTLDIHIDMIKNFLLHIGTPVLEIPPRPCNGYFIACLTHDVDFMGIKDHGLDRSVLGFAGRVLAMQGTRDSRGKVSFPKVLKNCKALFSLPAVHLGICKDFWLDLMKYRELEGQKPSTFFFIPFKGKTGRGWNGAPPSPKRRAKYDLNSYAECLCELLKSGSEIALHGIDAWTDSEQGIRELERIRYYNKGTSTGVRIHWLFFDKSSPGLLEKGSFSYDSSRGYNDAVGFMCGTSQVFRLWGTNTLLELPLNVMDTALFYKSRMGLKAPEAMKTVKTVLGAVRRHGGVFTLNWHTRSLSPERNWDDFYCALLALLESAGAVFLAAKDAVQWFAARRGISFGEIQFAESRMKVKLEGKWPSHLPYPRIILHLPLAKAGPKENFAKESRVMESHWLGEQEFEIKW